MNVFYEQPKSLVQSEIDLLVFVSATSCFSVHLTKNMLATKQCIMCCEKKVFNGRHPYNLFVITE